MPNTALPHKLQYGYIHRHLWKFLINKIFIPKMAIEEQLKHMWVISCQIAQTFEGFKPHHLGYRTVLIISISICFGLCIRWDYTFV